MRLEVRKSAKKQMKLLRSAAQKRVAELKEARVIAPVVCNSLLHPSMDHHARCMLSKIVRELYDLGEDSGGGGFQGEGDREGGIWGGGLGRGGGRITMGFVQGTPETVKNKRVVHPY